MFSTHCPCMFRIILVINSILVLAFLTGANDVLWELRLASLWIIEIRVFRGRAVAQADSFPSATADALLCIQSNWCKIFGDKVELEQFILPPPPPPHTHTLQFSCISILPPGLHTQYFAHLQSTLYYPSKRQFRYQKHFSLFQHIHNYIFLNVLLAVLLNTSV